MKAALYARVSTTDQHVENQLEELRSYVDSRGWSATEYVDKGVSGAKDRRPALMNCSRQQSAESSMFWSRGASIELAGT
jgi:DNA invertase Pin-like site-specific DNA recombinase